MRKFSAKKAAVRLVLPLFCLLLALGALPETAQAVTTVTAKLHPDVTILIDGIPQTFYAANAKQVHPILYNGTTYLPVRAIGELMGKVVDWNQTTKTVTLSGLRTTPPVSGTPDDAAAVQDISAELRDDFTVIVDGTVRTFADAGGNTVYPLLYTGTTYLPVRAIGELMGKAVSWDGKTKTVTLTGSLVSDADTFSGASAAGTGLLTADEAAAKALAHANLTSAQVTFVQKKLEWDDGRQVYDIEFYTSDLTEYDYEIDALTGEIRDFDWDAESFTPSSPSLTGASGTTITLDKVREIALAKVPGAAASHIVKLKPDYDDGQLIYEVEILYNQMEYELEIDAASGKILAFEAESIHD